MTSAPAGRTGTSVTAPDLRCAASRSTARRLLDGAGRATVVAYRDDPDRPHAVLAHGLTPADLIAVALHDGEGLPEPNQCGEVRLRIDQHGADPSLRVATASLHALAHLRVVDDSELDTLRSLDLLPTDVGWAAEAGAPVALLALDRVVLHGQGGVSAHRLADVVGEQTFPRAVEEWECREIVAGLGAERTENLLADVLTGRRPGSVGHEHRTPTSALTHVGRTLLADVDSIGCTWLRVEQDRTRTVFAAFPRPVTSVAELGAAVAGLTQPAV